MHHAIKMRGSGYVDTVSVFGAKWRQCECLCECSYSIVLTVLEHSNFIACIFADVINSNDPSSTVKIKGGNVTYENRMQNWELSLRTFS
jgi:hypothetical protein